VHATGDLDARPQRIALLERDQQLLLEALRDPCPHLERVDRVDLEQRVAGLHTVAGRDMHGGDDAVERCHDAAALERQLGRLERGLLA
jgi:hypothetical protein